MKKIHKLLNQKAAKKIAGFMKAICYIIIFLFAMMLIMCCMGRLQYNLRVGDKTYPNAIYAEESHDFSVRNFTVQSNDDLRIFTPSEDGKIDLLTYIAIAIMYAINIAPLMFAYWFLAKVFGNVAKGEIFVEKNAHYILYYAVIQACVAVVVPFVKLFIVQIANTFVADRISLATGMNMINQLVPSIAFFVAAYIINYGVHLQDEVDHTL